MNSAIAIGSLHFPERMTNGSLKACAPRMRSPHSFATTLVEMAHSLEFAMHHLPALTELSVKKDHKKRAEFLIDLSDRFL